MITKAYNLRQSDVTAIEQMAGGEGSNSAALRQIITEWSQMQPLRLLGQMCALGLMPPTTALEQLTTIVSEMPAPYQVTAAGEAAIAAAP